MTKILNKLNIVNEKTSERTSFDFKGQGGSGDYMKVAVTLSSEPTISTLSHDGVDFVIGDLARVADNNSETGYSFYRLHDISNGEAVWSKLATGEVDDSAIVTVNMESNQSDDSEFTGGSVTISYGQTTETKTGTSAQFTVPAGASYTITLNSVTGYGGQKFSSNSSSTITETASEYGRISYTGTYCVEILSITSLSIDEGSLNGQVVTVNGVSKTYGTDSLPWTWRIPYGTSDAITASKSGYNLTITKSPNTDVADSTTKTATLSYTAIKSGIFVIDANGNEVDAAQGDSSYIGVVVRDTDKGIAFILDKNTKQKNNIRWSNNNYGSNAAGITEFSDYDSNATSTFRIKSSVVLTKVFGYYNNGETGVANTNIIKAFDSTESDNAALYCYNQTKTINKQTVHGYLGTVAEWYVLSSNISAVNTALSKIGGTQFSGNNYWWTSAECSAYNAWSWYYNSGAPYFSDYNKFYSNSDLYAVPFYPIP